MQCEICLFVTVPLIFCTDEVVSSLARVSRSETVEAGFIGTWISQTKRGSDTQIPRANPGARCILAFRIWRCGAHEPRPIKPFVQIVRISLESWELFLPLAYKGVRLTKFALWISRTALAVLYLFRAGCGPQLRKWTTPSLMHKQKRMNARPNPPTACFRPDE